MIIKNKNIWLIDTGLFVSYLHTWLVNLYSVGGSTWPYLGFVWYFLIELHKTIEYVTLNCQSIDYADYAGLGECIFFATS